MRADRKGNPQCKAIFAMFAQRTEGFPLGGKKTASSLSRKRLMRGDKSALMKDTLPTRPNHQSCAKPHFLPPRTSQSTQKLPCTATAVFKTEKNFADRNGGCRAGKFGEGQGGLEGRETPPKGVSLRLQGLPKSPRQPPLPWQGVRVLRGWKGFSDAERRGKARRRPS